MKQIIDIKEQRQNGQGIGNAIAGLNQSINWVQPNFLKCQIISISPALSVNRESQGLGREGPPGQTQSHEPLQFQFPIHSKYSKREFKIEINEV